ncbi:tocopherol cyclase family protein [Pontibacter sp. G13]|uniref:tocopherol cyclase family protein n=1 Tax=Pontibacter sp. G13 TaxID=3074898 RepID=UPI00288A6620|nr:tocopherol cyclase family protein [Pontibacter sp. G13]WNJ17309.1 tocopherol cyclase family protein [Pontibacter sp. G13]
MNPILQNLRNLWHPLNYHGHHVHSQFFEGWYYKWIDPSEQYAFAVIPGISKGANGESHAFIQVMDGRNCVAHYHEFPAAEFWASDREFEVKIGDNSFSRHAVELSLDSLSGKVEFRNLTPWPSSFLSPGIMGWYSFVPKMQCKHGVVSLHHELSGQMTYEGHPIDFTGGIGYGEKDWGTSFPSSWIWMQTNHFEAEDRVSLSASIARIPWLGSSFVGFIAGMWINGTLYRFTTYTGAKLEALDIFETHVRYVLRDKTKRLELLAHKAAGSDLKSPIAGDMRGRVNESMNARVEVQLTSLSGGQSQLIFEGTGRNAGLEVGGQVEELYAGLPSHLKVSGVQR